ncbi:MAG: hypothetical protein JNN04_04370 [Cyclobacteriaceae bacterium]|nr:hypothetical protein [Cyclobacteriaceae bacterium]
MGPTSNSALVETFQVDLQHPGTIYLGFGSGNLWKTTNNGLSWKPIFENQPSYGIGDVALAPSNTNIIYLGTGETLKKPRNFTMPGTGVYRSDDGGTSWRHLGLSDTWHIGKVTVHPTNPDIVYVAAVGHLWSKNATRGVFRTIDGGKTWEHVLFVNDRTGANDIVLAPSNPNIVYASMWESYPGVSGVNSGIYKSTDAGKTWTKSDSGLPVDAGKGRIGLAVSYQDPNKVYALLDHRDKPRRENDAMPGAAEVYRSVDGGKNWKRTHDEELMIFSTIGWYFADIVVDPRNDEEIYALGVRLAHSTDGGKSFGLVGGDVYHLFPNPAEPLHLDQCELWINPQNPNHLALANDGGFYVSHDRGATWMHLNNLPTGEFYDITIDRRTPYTIYAGAQDDATVYGPGNEWIPKRYDNWKYLWIDPWSGGDGCVTVVDPLDSNTIYYSSQEGGIRRMDLRTRTSEPAQVSEEQRKSLRFNFISPYFLSSHTRTLYLGANQLMKSDDQGRTWKAASPDLATGKDKSKNSLALGAVVESPMKSGLLYAGTDKGLFWVTHDGGATWTEHSQGLPAAYARSIVPSRYQESRVYIALSGLNYDDFNTYLYKSEDYGKTWEKITGNLPGEVAYVIKEDPKHKNVLYAGLYRAVYCSVDGGKTWSQLGTQMPAAAISDLEIHERSRDLVVSTHGRGIYKMNLKPLDEWILNGMSIKDQLFAISPVHAPNPDKLPDDSNSMAYEKLPITFWQAEAGEVTLSLVNDSSKVVWSQKVTTRKGFNQYRWDMILRHHSSPLPYFLGAEEFVKKGRYTLRIFGTKELVTTLDIVD